MLKVLHLVQGCEFTAGSVVPGPALPGNRGWRKEIPVNKLKEPKSHLVLTFSTLDFFCPT